jgi:dTDP-4-amino-4,6-dideoxygalactose transaminase
VAVANGTDALVVALRALGLRPGDEVIVPAFSFFATAECVVLAGGVPVFCDIDPETFNLDPDDCAARVSERTVGVVGVHLYGRPFDFGRLREVVAARGLWLVEDAAQAHGARWRGRRVGTLGELAAWSFYPTKNLGAFGDGGALSGMDEELLQKAHRLANHGQTSRYHHVEVGTNSRLDSLQAAVLNLRLATLDEDNASRRRLAELYRRGARRRRRRAPAARPPRRRVRRAPDDDRHRTARRAAAASSPSAASAPRCTTRHRSTASRRWPTCCRCRRSCRTPSAPRARCSACRCSPS